MLSHADGSRGLARSVFPRHRSHSGLYLSRRVTHGDFFVAGRTLGPGLLFSTLLAANIGAGSTVGAAGLGYRDGLSALWWVGVSGTRIDRPGALGRSELRRIAAAHDLRTVGDFLEWRYDHRVRAAVERAGLGRRTRRARRAVRRARIPAQTPRSTGPSGSPSAIGGLVVVAYAATGGLENIGVAERHPAVGQDAWFCGRAAAGARRCRRHSTGCARRHRGQLLESDARRRLRDGFTWRC